MAICETCAGRFKPAKRISYYSTPDKLASLDDIIEAAEAQVAVDEYIESEYLPGDRVGNAKRRSEYEAAVQRLQDTNRDYIRAIRPATILAAYKELQELRARVAEEEA